MAQGPASTKREERVNGTGNISLFVRSWRPDGDVRGVVAIVPGFNSHSGYYAWAADQFAASGLAVYAVDLRGRGQSDGERFFVELQGPVAREPVEDRSRGGARRGQLLVDRERG